MEPYRRIERVGSAGTKFVAAQVRFAICRVALRDGSDILNTWDDSALLPGLIGNARRGIFARRDLCHHQP